MAYDSQRGVTVLFGGDNGSRILADTWEWDGTTWERRDPPISPPARYHHAMAYDSSRNVVVLFGGKTASEANLGDTWEWDGTTWTRRSPVTRPPARWIHSMAYDSAREVVVLYGGSGDCGGGCDDTWEWDGITWTQKTPPVSPPWRWGHAMAFDSIRNVTVLYGGRNNLFPLEDTWEWDGVRWKKNKASPNPSLRDNSTLVFDSSRGVSVLYAGFEAGVEGYHLGDTWEWDGSSWGELSSSSSPGVREDHAMVYDSKRQVSVLFGGSIGGWPPIRLADTWEYHEIEAGEEVEVTQSPAPTEEAEIYYASVPANVKWVNSGIFLETNDEVTISVSGTWTNNINRFDPYGPDGHPEKDSQSILPEIKIGTLIGRIANGPRFPIGSYKAFTAENSGELKLSMNDTKNFSDNAGEMNMTVIITRN